MILSHFWPTSIFLASSTLPWRFAYSPFLCGCVRHRIPNKTQIYLFCLTFFCSRMQIQSNSQSTIIRKFKTISALYPILFNFRNQFPLHQTHSGTIYESLLLLIYSLLPAFWVISCFFSIKLTKLFLICTYLAGSGSSSSKTSSNMALSTKQIIQC